MDAKVRHLVCKPGVSLQYTVMLSYQHSYHAVNHADVVKHVLLTEMLAAMLEAENADNRLIRYPGSTALFAAMLRDAARAVAAAYRRFAQGVYIIWYPLLPKARHEELFQELRRSGIRNILWTELDCCDCFPDMQMRGAGLITVNPPWHAQAGMHAALDWLCEHLTHGQGHPRFDWLVPE